jgi:uncharacterized protein (TIGR02186 family)
MTRASITTAAALAGFLASGSADAERLVSSLSSHRVQINSSFNGVELVLFGTVERDNATVPRRSAYDVVATATGPHENIVTRRKDRMFGVWVNSDSQSFVNVPSYLAVLATRPYAIFASPDTLRRLQVGIENTELPQRIGGNVVDTGGDDPFRQALLRIKGDHGLYSETTNGVTFLTPTLYRASIFVPAEAEVGNYEVDVKLFADGEMIARTSSAFEIITVGFERFIAGSAVDHGILYGLATATMALMTGWFASIVFRRD